MYVDQRRSNFERFNVVKQRHFYVECLQESNGAICFLYVG